MAKEDEGTGVSKDAADVEEDPKSSRKRRRMDLLKRTAFVAFTLVLPLADVASDFLASANLIRAGHSSWGWSVAYLTFVPSVYCVIVREKYFRFFFKKRKKTMCFFA